MIDDVDKLTNGNKFEITLIDFGFAKKFYYLSTGKHMPQTEVDEF